MPTHDCSKCDHTDECPLIDIATWLNDHENEVGHALSDQKVSLAKSCTRFAADFPLAMLCHEEVTRMAMECFVLGFCKGRTYPVVPAVYEKEVR